MHREETGPFDCCMRANNFQLCSDALCICVCVFVYTFAFKEIFHSNPFSKEKRCEINFKEKDGPKLCDEQVDTTGDPFVTVVVTIHSRTIEQTD